MGYYQWTKQTTEKEEEEEDTDKGIEGEYENEEVGEKESKFCQCCCFGLDEKLVLLKFA